MKFKIKNICCIGAGYVGGPTMSVIALKCPEIKVTLVDTDEKKIDAWNGNYDLLPVYEPGLLEIVKKTRGRNLFFSKDLKKSIDNAEMIFMAVNTPTKTSGDGAGMAADLKYIEKCTKDIARYSKSNKIIIEKSTLPVRTAEKIKQILIKENKNNNFEILSNPEFLAEGTAIQDLFKSDRVLIGGDNTPNAKKAVRALVDIYSRWIPREKILETNVWSSELAKLASNAMLAQRISSINSLSALCEKTGADIDQLSKAIGMDQRIGPKFLKASVGFGGSCFKKDILNLVYLSKFYGLDEVAEYWHQVIKINNYQKFRFSYKIINSFKGKINDKKIAILGWAFKAETNDSRESASINISSKLLEHGAFLKIYDPKVRPERIKNDLLDFWKNKKMSADTKNHFLSKLVFCRNLEEALLNADASAILTEWEEFKNYNWTKAPKKIKIFDGRNIINIKSSNLFKI